MPSAHHGEVIVISGSDEKTLVLVPGLICTDKIWSTVLEGGALDCRVHIANTTSDDTIKDMAARLLEEVEGDFAIAGVSMGGYVTLEVLAQAPERVTHFALIDTNAYADSDSARTARRAGIERAEQGGYESYVRDLFVKFALGETAQNNDELVEEMVAMALEVGAEDFIRQSKAIMGRQGKSVV